MGVGPVCRTSLTLAFPSGSWATFPIRGTVPNRSTSFLIKNLFCLFLLHSSWINFISFKIIINLHFFSTFKIFHSLMCINFGNSQSFYHSFIVHTIFMVILDSNMLLLSKMWVVINRILYHSLSPSVFFSTLKRTGKVNFNNFTFKMRLKCFENKESTLFKHPR